MIRQVKTFLKVALLALAVTGCGTAQSVAPKGATPGAVSSIDFRPDYTNSKAYANIEVVDASGKAVSLNVQDGPVMFEAYWCPHCQRTLRLWMNQRNAISRVPALVSTGFQKGTSLSDAVRITQKEFSTIGVKNVHIYYLLSGQRQYAPAGYPTVVFPYQHRIALLVGEHPLSTWLTALHPSNG